MQDKSAMYSVGSLFYAIYFFVSFPMYFRMDEQPRHKWTAGQAAVDSLAAGMLVTILLDLWRLFVGSIWETGSVSSGLPWLQQGQ
jgi:cycloeucalenol cycloisomerase